jgi:hypothetical protein
VLGFGRRLGWCLLVGLVVLVVVCTIVVGC